MILVTGASGFIGRHLCAELEKRRGAEALLCLASQPVPYGQYLFHENYTFDPDFFVKNGYSDIETVILAGAFIPKHAGDADNEAGCFSNILSTRALLCAELPRLQKVIFISSTDVYSPTDRPIDELSETEPTTLYGASKWYGEKMLLAAAREKKFAPVILRVGHVYGPGEEKYQKMIPFAMRQMLAGKDINLKNGGSDERCFLYIADLVRYIADAVALPLPTEPVNLTGAETVSMKTLVDKIANLAPRPVTVHTEPAVRQPLRYLFDRTRMESLFAVKDTPLHEGLEKEWSYLKNLPA